MSLRGNKLEMVQLQHGELFWPLKFSLYFPPISLQGKTENGMKLNLPFKDFMG